MAGRLPGRPDEDAGPNSPGPASGRPGRRVITVMLLATAAADLARCGVAVTSARHAGPTAGLVFAGLATAVLSLRAAQGWKSRRRWPPWAALAVALASGPQSAAFTLRSPFAFLDAATAVLGVLLAVAVLATAGRARSAVSSPAAACDLHRTPAARPPLNKTIY